MLISNENNTYLMKRMETFDTVITPVRRNVARKSTSNRPLLNSIVKEPLKQVKRNDFVYDENIVAKNNSCINYPSYVPHDFQLYFEDDNTNSKRTLIDSSKQKNNSCTEAIDKYIQNSQYSLLHEESDDEDVNLSGVFCVSNDLAKYLDEGNLSPTTKHDSSDESIDLSRVSNYPVKVERCRNDQFYETDKVISTVKDPVINACKNIKQELISEGINEDNLQPDIVIDSIVSADTITELGTQTKKCLFDPNLESVTCKVNVREEVLVCENVPLKMTILEANFVNLDHLDNIVEDNSIKEDLVSKKDDNEVIGPQVICAVSLGSGGKDELSDTIINSQTADEQKKCLKKNKKVSFKKEPSKTTEIKAVNKPTINEKRLTRSQVHVNNKRRITRNSMRLNTDSLVPKEDASPEINENEIIESPLKNDLIDESQKSINDFTNELTENLSTSDENPDVHCNQDKADCKKKASIDKKGKKDINEGVLLHVEATKETELMRDGKIIKDKEEYLKDIESKIDRNLPVVVEKEFDIQQSLTEEILLDQALRLAHQRTSPRLSKIMKEAILKATVQKPCTKSKQTKNTCSKLEIKSKGNKPPIFQKHNSEESELSDSILSNSTASESNSDKTVSTDSLNDDIDENGETFRNHKKKKTENYVVAPVAKQTNAENTVEPLTIKICRKANKKKSGFRLSLKKKRSPKKKEGVISKPICSKVVDMDDLSKTFEDILQDDNWCNDDKISVTGSDNCKEENAESTENKNINTKHLNNDKNGFSPTRSNIEHLSTSSQIDNVISEENNIEKTICGNFENEKNNINKGIVNKIGNNELPNVDNSKPDSIVKDSAINNDSPIPLSGAIITSFSDNNSSDSVSKNGKATDIVSEKNSNLNLEHLSKDCNTDFLNRSTVSNSSSSTKLSIEESNKLTVSSMPRADLSNESPTSNALNELNNSSSDIHSQLQGLQNDLQFKNSFPSGVNKTVPNSKILGNQYDQVHQMINTADDIHEKINNKEIATHQKQTLDILKCPLISPVTEIQPKVLPLSIASRDPRLRKSHVKVIVEVSTSSVSSSPGKSDLQQETRIISQVMQNVTKELDSRKDVDSDSEANESQIEIDRRKKIRKREVDAELLYKTPLSDLHDMPERTSYSRSIRKRSPPKTDKRDPRTVWRKENNFIQNNDRISETYREYHEVNVCSRMTHQETIRNEVIGSPSEFKINDYFPPDYRAVGQYRLDTHQSEHFHSFRTDSDLRQSENFGQNSSAEYVNEVRNTKDFTERVYQNQSDHHRVGYQFKEIEEDYRFSENYPPDCAPPDNYPRGYKRLSDFNSDHSHHGSPDFREREHVNRERNHMPHNEPSYSRWDYAHKKVEGHFPPEINNEKEEKNLQPDKMTNLWQEERDLIDGPVKSFTKPYYRRKKFSRGDELFERRSSPWDVDNRRYGENERLWARKTDKELIHGPERDTRWDRRGRGKGYRVVREDRSRSPRRDHDRYPGKRPRSPRTFLRNRREASPSPRNSPVVLDSPMSPEPADRYCVLEPTKCLTVPQ